MYSEVGWPPSVFRRKHGTSVRTHVTAQQHQSIASPARFLSWRKHDFSMWFTQYVSLESWKWTNNELVSSCSVFSRSKQTSLIQLEMLPTTLQTCAMVRVVKKCLSIHWSSLCGLSTAIHKDRQRRHENLHLEPGLPQISSQSAHKLAKTWTYRLHYVARSTYYIYI